MRLTSSDQTTVLNLAALSKNKQAPDVTEILL